MQPRTIQVPPLYPMLFPVQKEKPFNKLFETMKKILIIVSSAFVLLFIAYDTFEPRLKNPDYFLWTVHGGPFKSKYHALMGRDCLLDFTFRGKSAESLRAWFPDLADGSTFEPKSYRGSYTSSAVESNPHAKVYWESPDECSFGWCFVLVDGKVTAIHLVKG